MGQLYWNRIKVILGVGTVLFCLIGCSALQPIFSPESTTDQALDIVSTAVSSANLWWPITFAGFLALLAGIINLVFLRGGAKLLVIGIILAMTPPIVDRVAVQLAPWISIIIAIAGLALLAIVFGRWFGQKDILNRVKLREKFIRNTKDVKLGNDEVAEVLAHVGDRKFDPEYKVK